MKYKSHIISLDEKNTFDKIFNPLKKNCQQAGYRENISQHKKGHILQAHT